ncbi:hypothetical protein [Epilithonimonas sp. UC225_85]|uniref:hypothetical protein n=1 Tax=Epilithonimonas sp. UC225_85 TaxID=3350167 RepID=UPI0036D3C85E
MVKKILILLVSYAILLVAIVLTLSENETLYLSAIVVSGLLFGLLVLREILKQNIFKSKPEKYHLNYQNINPGTLTKISKRTFLFGLEKRFISDNEFYFDNDDLYISNHQNQLARFPFKDISELSRTSIRINNSPIWQLKITGEGQELVFRFAHNYAIFNKSFQLFYEKLKEVNPASIKSEWSLWRM